MDYGVAWWNAEGVAATPEAGRLLIDRADVQVPSKRRTSAFHG